MNRIDFVLVWDPKKSANSYQSDDEQEQILRRNTFERNLEKEGLILEHECAPEVLAFGMNIVKITAPQEVLKRYAEILKLRLPMKKVTIF